MTTTQVRDLVDEALAVLGAEQDEWVDNLRVIEIDLPIRGSIETLEFRIGVLSDGELLALLADQVNFEVGTESSLLQALNVWTRNNPFPRVCVRTEQVGGQAAVTVHAEYFVPHPIELSASYIALLIEQIAGQSGRFWQWLDENNAVLN